MPFYYFKNANENITLTSLLTKPKPINETRQE